jgi:hypothetical protein
MHNLAKYVGVVAATASTLLIAPGAQAHATTVTTIHRLWAACLRRSWERPRERPGERTSRDRGALRSAESSGTA